MKKTELAYILDTLEIMKRPLSDETPEMVGQIKEAEGRIGYLYFLLAAANADLDVQTDAAAEVLKPQGLTAYVLKSKVEAMVSGYRRERDEIQGLVKALEGRQMTGGIILKYLRNLSQE